MTTTTAVKATGNPTEKEKAEKRRALGRGLESLLPGPRVVRAAAAADAQQVPHRPSPVRNDIADGSGGAEPRPAGQPRTAVPTQAHSPREVTHSHPVAGSATRVEQPAGSIGRANASAPTQPEEPAMVPFIRAEVEEEYEQQVPHRPSPVRNDIVDGTKDEESITILAQAETRVPGNLVINLAIADIDKNPYQTRYVQSGDALDELTNSIKANGVLQPIVVRPAEEEGRYVLILGERRLHASKLAGKDAVPAIVRRVSAQQAAEMTIIENLQREDLSPLEQAQAFKVLSEEFKLTQTQIGEKVGLSRESVANYMRLLRLPREVMQLLAEKRIKFAEAKELLKLNDNDKIKEAALYAVKKGMTVEQVERLVMRMEGFLDPIPGMPGQERKKSGARWVDPNVRAAQMEMERLLGVRVKIRDRKGHGKIVIEYATVDDYERVVSMLRGKDSGH